MDKAKDIKGQTFGMLTVIERAANDKYGNAMWKCVCSCPLHTEVIVRGASLRNGTQSCGCLQREKTSEAAKKLIQDLTGEKIGRLTVIERAPNKGKEPMWRCVCENDGNEVVVSGARLRSGKTKSCGCLRADVSKEKSTTHGKYYTRVHNTWTRMKQRCGNPRHPEYDGYGKRGIKVCERWQDFEPFYDDVSKLPHFDEPGYTLNRIDNDGNYEPGNVEWATPAVQANNKRNNIRIPYNGKEQTLKQWTDELNLNYKLTHKRIKYLGWPIEKAFNPPTKQH